MFDLDALDKPVDIAAGEWVSDIHGHPGMRLKVRSKAFKAFETAHNKLLRGFSTTISETLDSDEYNVALGELMADHILLDWENALASGGKPVAYDKALASKILTSVDDRRMGKSFRDAVAMASSSVMDRHLGIVDAMVGN